jgi:hypothetical protein
MWKAVEKLRLREVYQPLTVPAKAASDASDARSARTRVCQCITENSSLSSGKNGVPRIYPFWGIIKSFD